MTQEFKCKSFILRQKFNCKLFLWEVIPGDASKAVGSEAGKLGQQGKGALKRKFPLLEPGDLQSPPGDLGERAENVHPLSLVRAALASTCFSRTSCSLQGREGL